ncbi:MAG: AI-2E family transporter [Clostridia bacterium]|nr:AI-2E family transporter [Clostridia bacterium]
MKIEKKDKISSGSFRLFLVIAASILFFFAIYRIDIFLSAISTVLTVLEPVFFGLVIAYLLNPLVDIFEKKVFPKIFKKGIGKRLKKFVDIVSIFFSMLIFCLILWGIVILIIPAVVESIGTLSSVLPQRIMKLIDNADEYLNKNDTMKYFSSQASLYVQKWIQTDLSSIVYKSVDYVFFGVLGVVNFLKNFAIGMLISVYILYSKEKFGNQSRKILCACFKQKTVNNILIVLKKSNSVFNGFIYGKILDSVIIGVICFVGITILDMPYRVLVATIVGITNIIPIFGPYIGAIPCAALILLTDPIKGIYFIIFIILLQTLDGNVIGPKILGGKTGIESFWVIFAILIGGGLFGVLGMILGVPVFAVIYYFVAMQINRMLKKKKMSTNSEDYAIDNFNLSENEVTADEEE